MEQSSTKENVEERNKKIKKEELSIKDKINNLNKELKEFLSLFFIFPKNSYFNYESIKIIIFNSILNNKNLFNFNFDNNNEIKEYLNNNLLKFIEFDLINIIENEDKYNLNKEIYLYLNLEKE